MQTNKLPKPALVHCDSVMRAAAIVLMHIATRQATLRQAFKQAEQLGLFGIVPWQVHQIVFLIQIKASQPLVWHSLLTQ